MYSAAVLKANELVVYDEAEGTAENSESRAVMMASRVLRASPPRIGRQSKMNIFVYEYF